MGPPPIALFLTSIASQPVLRKKQEYYLRILQAKKIPFTTYDLASDEAAKKMWRRTAPKEHQQLPGMLVGHKYPGSFEKFEEAVEYGELDIFLRRNEEWNPLLDEDRPAPAAQIVGIPGAHTPSEMTPERLRATVKAGIPTNEPRKGLIPVNKRTDEHDAGALFPGFGLSGHRVTQDELADLIADLGLGGEEAKEMAKGLAGDSAPPPSGGTTRPLGRGKAKAEETKDTVKPDVQAEKEKPSPEPEKEAETEETKDKEEPPLESAKETEAKATEANEEEANEEEKETKDS